MGAMSASRLIQNTPPDTGYRLLEDAGPEVTSESAVHAAVAEIGATRLIGVQSLGAPPIDVHAELPLQAAVAERKAARGETEVWHSNCTTPCPSVAGDTIASSSAGEGDESDAAVAERRDRRRAPLSTTQGASESTHKSSKWNAEPEVGNFGIFFGNWGARATLGGARAQQRRRETMDLQLKKNPAMVVVVAEASAEVEEILKTCRSRGSPELQGVQSRDDHEHYVIRGEEECAILIGARKDNTTSIELLEYHVSDDHGYNEKGKPKMARTRTMIAKIQFKQHVGHLGKEIVVAGVHGHYRTMKYEWPAALKCFWDSFAQRIRRRGVQIVAGDFNMSLTQVPVELGRRGIACDCIAWYPWRHATMSMHDQALGLDSCGIFYIGGNIQATLNWSLGKLVDLTAVADQMQDSKLDVYSGQNHPGQHWSCYRSSAFKEAEADKNLEQRLQALLTPTTTDGELAQIPKRTNSFYCPYLRFKEKRMDKEEWLVDGELHNGAHFPLCVFTNNSRSRSEAGSWYRAAKKGKQHKGKGKQDKGKGNSEHNTAVAEQGTVWGGKGKGAKKGHGHGSRATATTA